MLHQVPVAFAHYDFTRCLLPSHIMISPGACCLNSHITISPGANWFHTLHFHQVPVDFTDYKFAKCLLPLHIRLTQKGLLPSHKECVLYLFLFTWVYVSIKCNNSLALFISHTVLLSTSVKIHSHIKSMDINADNFCAWCQTQIPE